MRTSPWLQRLAPFMGVLIILTITLNFLRRKPAIHARWSVISSQHSLASLSLHQQRRDFWDAFYKDVTDTRPTCAPITQERPFEVVTRKDHAPPQRVEAIRVEDAQVRNLRATHALFLDRLQHRKYELPYIPGSRGIVMTADNEYLFNALVSIHMIRQTGCTLPIELFVSDPAESDPRICHDILPTLGVNCLFLTDVIGEEAAAARDKFEYKVLAMLLSSFDEFLSLDADCFPVYNPEVLFVSAPFNTHGLTIWPDFWHASESKHFFDIIQFPVEDVGVSLTSESAQLMYAKRTHTNALLMAAYYNLHGPGYYYKLQSQGGAGEGDKETFSWGARVTRSSFYHVREDPLYLGYHGTTGKLRGSNIGQYDPRLDFAIANNKDSLQRKRPFFIHARYPKLNPKKLFISTSVVQETPNFDEDQNPHRLFGEDTALYKSLFDTDTDHEQIMWETISDFTCEYRQLFSKRMCRLGRSYVSRLFYNGTDWR